VDVRSPALLCVPTGARADDAGAVECCYKLKAPSLKPAVTPHVSDAFGSLALGVKTPKLLCQPCTLIQ
jgi:hypothetical protein